MLTGRDLLRFCGASWQRDIVWGREGRRANGACEGEESGCEGNERGESGMDEGSLQGDMRRRADYVMERVALLEVEDCTDIFRL